MARQLLHRAHRRSTGGCFIESTLLLCALLYACPGCQAFTTPVYYPWHHRIATATRYRRHNSLWSLAATATGTTSIQVGEEIGTGSYGTVHFCSLEGSKDMYIGKRSLIVEELQQLNTDAADAFNTDKANKNDPKERAERCQYYWDVEDHCYTKLSANRDENGAQLQVPTYLGSDFRDDQDRRWMLFDIVPSTLPNDTDTSDSIIKPAPSLTDLMKLDHDKQHDQQHPHHLYYLQQALGLTDEDASLGNVLDVFLQSLLRVLSDVHAQKIVHRDLKPSNLLISHGSVYLIDFGSAADLEPSQGGIFRKTYVGLENSNRVAISPIYSAPEVFVDRNDKPENFDVFSAALIYCQLLFNFLDERTDAGFHQQLAISNEWNLDTWLEQELASKVRPKGLEEALVVLSERPGLWRLLKEMFRPEPWYRISSQDALRRLEQIISPDTETSIKGEDLEKLRDDGPFLPSVLETFEICDVIDFPDKTEAAAAPTNSASTARSNTSDLNKSVSLDKDALVRSISRPLHFVASFKRNTSMGLILSEAAPNTDDDGDEFDEETRQLWVEATRDAVPGQVFVKGIVPGGQAEEFGIFEVGDQLQGVGELPVAERGFEKVVDLLGKQPPSSQFVTLHFDRKKSPLDTALISKKEMASNPIYPVDSGAWSSKGRRKSQEDRFVLHEILDSSGRSVLVAGVFDGHAGTAASTKVSDEMPGLVTDALFQKKNADVSDILENAWGTICQEYQNACQSETECVAAYDEREGILDANTGAVDLSAGTTATVAALDESNGKIAFLNCGDSRTLLIDKNGNVVFATTDHTPEQEMNRLREGKKQGLDYSIPECSVSRWYLSIGDWQYAVGRSLEGPIATAKGIVSLPDMTTVQGEPGFSIICASDGLWEVMDSGEVAHVIASVRKQGSSAGDAAKTVCSMAIEKGTSDNVSAVIVYLE